MMKRWQVCWGGLWVKRQRGHWGSCTLSSKVQWCNWVEIKVAFLFVWLIYYSLGRSLCCCFCAFIEPASSDLWVSHDITDSSCFLNVWVTGDTVKTSVSQQIQCKSSCGSRGWTDHRQWTQTFSPVLTASQPPNFSPEVLENYLE